MSLKTERDIRVFAAGVAIGAAVGAVVALLLAPKRGADLRQDLSRSAARMGETITSGVSRARDAATSVLTVAGPFVDTARDAWKPAGEEMAEDRADLRARSQDMVAEGGPDVETH